MDRNLMFADMWALQRAFFEHAMAVSVFQYDEIVLRQTPDRLTALIRYHDIQQNFPRGAVEQSRGLLCRPA